MCESWIHSAVWDFTMRSGPHYFMGGAAVKGCLCTVAGRECGEKKWSNLCSTLQRDLLFYHAWIHWTTTPGFLLARKIFWPLENKTRQTVFITLLFFSEDGGKNKPKNCLFASKVTSLLVKKIKLFSQTSYSQIMLFAFWWFSAVCTTLNIKIVQAEP